MRITIETNQQESLGTAVQVLPEPAYSETMNGGGPSPTEKAEMDAGPPPEWLLKAIKNATSSGIEDTSIDIDAGPPPNSKDY